MSGETSLAHQATEPMARLYLNVMSHWGRQEMELRPYEALMMEHLGPDREAAILNVGCGGGLHSNSPTHRQGRFVYVLKKALGK